MKPFQFLGSVLVAVFLILTVGCGGVSPPPRPTWAADFGSDKHGHWADLRVESIVQRMRWIPPGTYQRGSPDNEKGRDDGETQHQVTLTQGYWLASTECSVALWQAVMENDQSLFTCDPLRPLQNVCWDDTQEFLRQLNSRVPSLQARLPTEAEWEYAARAGTTTPFSFGAKITPAKVNYDGVANGQSLRHQVDVGSLPANAWGLHEMHGNVWEWCSDWYGDYPTGAVTDPIGPASGSNRVLRGGSWKFIARYCRSASRFWNEPGFRDYDLGFRFLAQSTPVQGGGAP